MVSINPNEDKLFQLLLVIERKLSLPQTPPCKLYIQQVFNTETSGFCICYTNEPQGTLLELVTCLSQRKLSVCTDNTLLIIYPWLKNIEYYLITIQQSIIFFRRMEGFFRGSLDKLQLRNYSRKSISSIMDLTTVFSISVNCNILRQNVIYPVPFDPIPSGHIFIHIDVTIHNILQENGGLLQRKS